MDSNITLLTFSTTQAHRIPNTTLQISLRKWCYYVPHWYLYRQLKAYSITGTEYVCLRWSLVQLQPDYFHGYCFSQQRSTMTFTTDIRFLIRPPCHLHYPSAMQTAYADLLESPSSIVKNYAVYTAANETTTGSVTLQNCEQSGTVTKKRHKTVNHWESFARYAGLYALWPNPTTRNAYQY